MFNNLIALFQFCTYIWDNILLYQLLLQIIYFKKAKIMYNYTLNY